MTAAVLYINYILKNDPDLQKVPLTLTSLILAFFKVIEFFSLSLPLLSCRFFQSTLIHFPSVNTLRCPFLLAFLDRRSAAFEFFLLISLFLLTPLSNPKGRSSIMQIFQCSLSRFGHSKSVHSHEAIDDIHHNRFPSLSRSLFLLLFHLIFYCFRKPQSIHRAL